VLHVDDDLGDDARSRAEATFADTPWKTLGRAVQELLPGDTVLVAPGDYVEPAKLALTVSQVTIRGTGALPSDVLITTGPTEDAVHVKASRVRLENLWIDGAKRGIFAGPTGDRLVLDGVVVSSTAADAVQLRRPANVSISRSILTGAAGNGLAATKARNLEVRDTDIYANALAGADLQGKGARLDFVTVHANGKQGIRARAITLTVTNSIVTGNGQAGVWLKGGKQMVLDHCLFFANASDVNQTQATNVVLVPPDPASGDPLYVDPDGPDDELGGDGWHDDDLTLAPGSPAIDAGSDLATALGVTGSTTGGAPDTDMADLGAHR
jgi:hypothetical protein